MLDEIAAALEKGSEAGSPMLRPQPSDPAPLGPAELAQASQDGEVVASLLRGLRPYAEYERRLRSSLEEMTRLEVRVRALEAENLTLRAGSERLQEMGVELGSAKARLGDLQGQLQEAK